jgi:hypothetical protein
MEGVQNFSLGLASPTGHIFQTSSSPSWSCITIRQQCDHAPDMVRTQIDAAPAEYAATGCIVLAAHFEMKGKRHQHREGLSENHPSDQRSQPVTSTRTVFRKLLAPVTCAICAGSLLLSIHKRTQFLLFKKHFNYLYKYV